MTKYLDLSIKEINSKLKSKEIKPIDLVLECFERIENNKEYNAFITLNKEEAIKVANELDNVEVDNILFGIPIAIKDNIVTKGLKTTCGSKILSNFIPVYDATVVNKLKESCFEKPDKPKDKSEDSSNGTGSGDNNGDTSKKGCCGSTKK